MVSFEFIFVLIVVEAIFYTFHASIFFLLFYKRKTTFKGPFYNIFRIVIIDDLANFLITLLGLKISPFFTEFYKDHGYFASLALSVGTYFTIMQYLGHLLMALNRFTIFWFPISHENIWRQNWYIYFMVGLSFLGVCYRFHEPGEYTFDNDNNVNPSLKNKSMDSITFLMSTLIYITATCIAATLNLMSSIKFYFAKKSGNLIIGNDKSLFLVTCLIFAAQVFRLSYTFGRTIFSSNPTISAFLGAALPFVSDIFALTGSISLLLLSYDAALVFITGVSMLCQFYTLALIIWITPKSMIEYRRLLLLYTFWDLCFSFLVGVVLTPRIFFPGTGCIIQGIARDIYFLLTNTFGPDSGQVVVKLSMSLVVWTVAQIISVQDYCLFYRFTVVYPDPKFHDILVNKRIIIGTYTIGFSISFIFAFFAFNFMTNMKDMPPLMQVYNDTYPGVFDEIQPDSVLIWFDKDSMKIGVVLYSIIGAFIFSEILCYFTVFMILKILRQNASSFTKKTYDLHRQLTILLFLQISNPIIFIIAPITACAMAMLYDLKFKRSSGMAGLLFMSFYSISNTILTITFVSPYRNFTKKHTIYFIKKIIFRNETIKHRVVQVESTTALSIQFQSPRRHE